MARTPKIFSEGADASSQDDEEAPQQYLLPSGDIATLEVPDIFGILSQVGMIPDPITSSVIILLNTEGNYFDGADARAIQRLAHQEKGKYGIYALCRKDKTLDLKRKRGDGQTILGRLDVRAIDLDFVYYSFFRNGAATPLLIDPSSFDAGRPADAPRSDDDLSGENAS